MTTNLIEKQFTILFSEDEERERFIPHTIGFSSETSVNPDIDRSTLIAAPLTALISAFRMLDKELEKCGDTTDLESISLAACDIIMSMQSGKPEEAIAKLEELTCRNMDEYKQSF